MVNKYYAVRRGRKPGIYTSWSQCKSQIYGFASASYKSFTSKADAEAFMNDASSVNVKDSLDVVEIDGVVAYVDGSYKASTGEFAYGGIILQDKKEIERFSGKMSDPGLATMRNVAGEIKASEYAMRFCVNKGIRKVYIFHDYEGIAKWCTGEWKANKDGTKKYKSYYESIKDCLEVIFIKVKGHSGDKYNDVADMLAKAALGIE